MTRIDGRLTTQLRPVRIMNQLVALAEQGIAELLELQKQNI